MGGGVQCCPVDIVSEGGGCNVALRTLLVGGCNVALWSCNIGFSRC